MKDAKEESATRKLGYQRQGFPEATWGSIEAGIKSGEPIRPLLRRLKAEGMEVPSHVSVIRMARRRGWVTVEAQADALVQVVNAGADIIASEKSPAIRQQIVDKATKKLTLDELFREHGEAVLDEVKVALGRLRDRNVSPGEASFSLQRIMDGLSKLREAMEGKRPATAVQINQGDAKPRTEILIPSTMPRREQT